MKLTNIERDILTIIDDMLVNNFLERAQDITGYSQREIQTAIDSLMQQDLIEIVALPYGQGKENFYSRTLKVTDSMLNPSLRFDLDLRYSKDEDIDFENV